MTRLLLRTAATAIVLLVGGCAATGPSAPDASAPDASSSPSPSSPAGSAQPVPGDCTRGDTTSVATSYTVLSDDSTTPVTITYTAFTQAGETPIRSETVFGPVVTLLAYACVSDVSGGLWTFTATSTTPGSLACVLGYGGRIVARDAAYNEGLDAPETVDCTGNPGR